MVCPSARIQHRSPNPYYRDGNVFIMYQIKTPSHKIVHSVHPYSRMIQMRKSRTTCSTMLVVIISERRDGRRFEFFCLLVCFPQFSTDEQCVLNVKRKSIIIITNAPNDVNSWGNYFLLKTLWIRAGISTHRHIWAFHVWLQCARPSTSCCKGCKEAWIKNLSFKELTMQYAQNYCKVESAMCHQRGFKKCCMKSEGRKRCSTQLPVSQGQSGIPPWQSPGTPQ